MRFFTSSTLVALAVLAALCVPALPASAEVITSLSCIEDDFSPGDVVVLEHDVTCESLGWFAEGVTIDLNGHTVTATVDQDICELEDAWSCDIDIGSGGELSNGRLIGADVGANFGVGTVHDVAFDGSRVVSVNGDRNIFRNSRVRDGGVQRNSIFIDSDLLHTTRVDHSLLVRSPIHGDNWAGFHGIGFDVHHNWMFESDVTAGPVELNAPGDVGGTIHHNLMIDSSVGIRGVLGPTMGSMSITDNTVVRGGIQVLTDPPEFGIGGPLSIARNTVWFSRSPIHINSPFVLGDLTGNKAIFSGRCVGVTCSRW
jgi:hypothetical protein